MIVGKLVLFLPDGTTQAISLGKERVTIGRRADNDICLPYPAVSAEHAVIVTILADSFLEDLGSTNGTLVNGETVQKHFLRDRDQIDVGRQKLVYVEGDAGAVTEDRMHIERAGLRTFGEQVERVEPALARRSGDRASPAATDTLKADAAKAEPAGDAMPAVVRGRSQAGGAPKPAPMQKPAATPTPPRATMPLDLGLPSAESVAEPDRGSVRESTDRGLARMARIRQESPEATAQDSGSIDTSHLSPNPSPRAMTRPTLVRPAAEQPAAERSRDEQAPAVARIPRRRADAPVPPKAAPVPPKAAPAAQPAGDAAAAAERGEARITVLSGPSAGRTLIIDRDEVVIGRVGLQVATIDRMAGKYRLRLREGSAAPTVDGQPVEAAGQILRHGDVFEVAGARLEFVSRS